MSAETITIKSIMEESKERRRMSLSFLRGLSEEQYNNLSYLTDRQKEVTSAWLGLFGKEHLSFREAAELFGITQERVRQLGERTLQLVYIQF